MAQEKEQAKQQERATYLSLMGAFGGLFAGFALSKKQREVVENLQPLDMALLGLATYRAGRLLAYDKVTEPIRSPFTETKQDQFGAGEVVEPKGSGVQKALGQLIGCPTCSGTWVAAGLIYGLNVAPAPTRLFMVIMSVGGLAEILDTGVEALNWGSRAARKQAGTKEQEQEQGDDNNNGNQK